MRDPMSASFSRDEGGGPLPIILAAGLSTFLISFILHHPDIPNSIYSDIVSFWSRPLAYGPLIPYVESSFEYPPISGLILYVSSIIGRNLNGYYLTFSLILLSAYIATLIATYLISRRRGVGWEYVLMFLVLSPSMYFYLVYNFDIVLTAFLMTSLLLLIKGRIVSSALTFSLAALSKLSNLILLPIILMHVERNKRLTYLLYALTPFAAVNLTLYLINPVVFSETYLYHVRWGLENAWFIVLFPSEGSWDTARLFSLFLAGYGLLKVYLIDDMELFRRVFMAFAVLLLSSYVFTPQMVIWLLPLLAVLGRVSPAYYVMEVANVGIILTWFLSPEPTKWGSLPQYLAVLRASALFYLLMEVYRGGASQPRA